MRPLLALLIASIAACGGSVSPPVDPPDGQVGDIPEVTPDTEGLTLSAEGVQVALGDASLSLRPMVRIGGAWIAAEGCSAEGAALVCSAGEAGTLWLEGRLERLVARFEAAAEVVVEAIGVEGGLVLPGATGWLSNGFQSWSQSGVLTLSEPVSEEALLVELLKRGDDEILRDGVTHSWWHTAVGGGELSLFMGALTSARLKSWAQVYRGEAQALALRCVSGLTGDVVALSVGESVEGEAWFVALGDDLAAMGTAYAEALPSYRRSAEHAAPAEAGWNSWYDLFSHVTEEDVRENAALAAQILSPLLPEGAPPLRITVDDGWQRAWGDWTVNEKFPSGLDGLAADLSAQGFAMGVWLAPLLVSVDAPLASAHPEWLVEGAVFPHPVEGEMRVLDVTHPEAAAHLQEVIQTLVGWGYDFLKIDFLFAGTYEGGHHVPVTGMAHYHQAMALIREAAGPETVLLAVASPGIATTAYADGWRVGHDIAYEPIGAHWAFIPNQLRSVAARWPICLAVLCDADPVLMRGLPAEEVSTGGWVVALSGGALFLSDNLPALDEGRWGWGLGDGRVDLALSGRPAIPVAPFDLEPPTYLSAPMTDVFGGGESTHVTPVVWRLQDGGRLAINITDGPLVVEGLTLPERSARRLSD